MWNELHRILGVNPKLEVPSAECVPEPAGRSKQNEPHVTPAQPPAEPRPELTNEPAPAEAPTLPPVDNPPLDIPEGEVEPLPEEFAPEGPAV